MKSSTQDSNARKNVRSHSGSIRELCIFAMLGSVMFASKVIMEALPNIHLLGVLTISYTLCYRTKALIPIYLYVMLNGLFAGFNAWWIPYLYIWTLLWGAAMLLPRKMPRKLACAICSVLCALHGLFFGALYAPIQALMFGLNFEQTVAWIVAGIPFDIVHCISNLTLGFIAVPLADLLKKLSKSK